MTMPRGADLWESTCEHSQILSLKAFDTKFRSHFQIVDTGDGDGPIYSEDCLFGQYDDLGDALNGKGFDEASEKRCEPFPNMKSDPSCWGIRVEVIWKLWTFIK